MTQPQTLSVCAMSNTREAPASLISSQEYVSLNDRGKQQFGGGVDMFKQAKPPTSSTKELGTTPLARPPRQKLK